jgi:large subunit ribosomal protein L28
VVLKNAATGRGKLPEAGLSRYNQGFAPHIGNRLEHVMAQVCQVCGRGPQSGNNISHAHNVTKRRWNINLRPVHAKTAKGNKRMRVCTSCLRSGKIVKA